MGDVTGMVSRHLPKEGTDKVIFQDLVVKDPEEGLQSLFASGPLVQSGYRWFHSSKLRISHILILFMPTPDTHTGHLHRTSKPDIQAGQKIGAGKDFCYLYSAMRRMYAIILLIPVMALFAEVVTAASWCAKVSDCGAMAKTQEKCTVAARHQTCCGTADGCGQKCKKGPTGKDDQKGKDCGSCCVDCPMCCLVTFKPVFRLEITPQVTIIDYTVMPDNNLSDYFQRHWKPPNAFFLS
jgi:hypothetical protein